MFIEKYKSVLEGIVRTVALIEKSLKKLITFCWKIEKRKKEFCEKTYI